MNKRLEEGKRRYEQLMKDNPEFRAYMKSQERVPLKAFGRPMDDETRYSLALMFRPRSEEQHMPDTHREHERELAQRDGIHPDVSERYEESMRASEEREAIAAWAESNAAEMRSREPGSDWLQNMRAASISTLEEVARAIRDGAHREERE